MNRSSSGFAKDAPARSLAIGLVQAGLGYLRWSQMVPMLVAWSFVFPVALAFMLIAFQEHGDLMVQLHERASRIPGLGELLSGSLERVLRGIGWLFSAVEEYGADEAGGVVVNVNDVERRYNVALVVTRVWAVAAAVLLAVEWLWHLIRGEAPMSRRSLQRKLGLAFAASVSVVIALFALLFLAVGADESGPGIPGYAGAIPVGVALLFLPSAYSLGVSHYLGKVQRSLDGR